MNLVDNDIRRNLEHVISTANDVLGDANCVIIHLHWMTVAEHIGCMHVLLTWMCIMYMSWICERL